MEHVLVLIIIIQFYAQRNRIVLLQKAEGKLTWNTETYSLFNRKHQTIMSRRFYDDNNDGDYCDEKDTR